MPLASKPVYALRRPDEDLDKRAEAGLEKGWPNSVADAGLLETIDP
ncbi:hypothetical protein [Rhizobium ruizarguesonis]|nr:hypothetical protein [Rhizobium ruizarguesonis]